MGKNQCISGMSTAVIATAIAIAVTFELMRDLSQIQHANAFWLISFLIGWNSAGEGMARLCMGDTVLCQQR